MVLRSNFIGFLALAAFLPAADAAVKPLSYEKHVAPLLSKYCYDCHGNGKHKGDVQLDLYKDESAAAADPKTWEKVLQNVRSHLMPPEKKAQPSPGEADLVVRWIETQVFKCDCNHPDPGRVTLRRLNRAEYNNTIRDLVGVTFQPADSFPADDSGYGFDNIGDVLSVPPVLIEKYLAAAGKILDEAIVTEDERKPRTKRFEAGSLDGSAPGEPLDGGARHLAREGDIYVRHVLPRAGEYVFRAHAYGEQAGDEPARMTLSLGNRDLKTFDVPVTIGHAVTYEARAQAPAGTNRFAAAYINNLSIPAKKLDRNLIIEWLEISGPVDSGAIPLPETHRRIFPRDPAPSDKAAYAREIISRFAARAYRRPVKESEVARLVKFAETGMKEGEGFERSVQMALQAILVSPHFLFRGELQPEPNNPQSVHPIDEFALASRLSYFIWSTMPDEELMALAAQGKLRRQLETQVARMLKDPRSRALVDNFAGQWLQLRNLLIVTPDAATFPDFDEPLRAAMQRETEMFLENMIREDRSILDFLDANYTFVNERLAKHYDIAGVKGDAFQRVSLRGTQRSGVLTHGSVLTLTSNPTRTSPVKRGKYILENILGTPPPPPPPNVPELKETKLEGTLRQRMVQHRANPTCASCHDRMDPIGFGFENFDGVGAARTVDGDSPVDASGKLITGEEFKGATELTRVLAKKKRDEFVRCISDKMLTYALGRGTEFYDKCALDQIGKGLTRRNYKFSALVLEIVKSVPFQQRRGELDKSTETAAATR